MKQVFTILAGVGIGAAVGYSQFFCPDGSCPLTGSWYGGAVLGGMLALLFTGRG